jgi:hypothetical protein
METTTQPKMTKSTTKRVAAVAPAKETVEYRAYELYLQRGGNGGGELDDWLTAEQELLAAKPARKSKAA